METWKLERKDAISFALSFGHTPKKLFEEYDRLAFDVIDRDDIEQVIRVSKAVIKQIESRPIASSSNGFNTYSQGDTQNLIKLHYLTRVLVIYDAHGVQKEDVFAPAPAADDDAHDKELQWALKQSRLRQEAMEAGQDYKEPAFNAEKFDDYVVVVNKKQQKKAARKEKKAAEKAAEERAKLENNFVVVLLQPPQNRLVVRQLRPAVVANLFAARNVLVRVREQPITLDIVDAGGRAKKN